MKKIKPVHFLGRIFLFAFATSTFPVETDVEAETENERTNLAVIVRHAPNLNGGTIQGSLQQLNGENLTINSGFAMTGDLLVPGTPTVVSNGRPVYSGTISGTGAASPVGYRVTFNGNTSLRYLRTRTTPASLPTVSVPPSPAGTRSVNINSAGQSYADAATLRNLTLNGNVGMIAVPPGSYGSFNVNGGSGLVLGVTGGVQAVNYNLQNLNLNGGSTLKIIGPVTLTLTSGFNGNGTMGASNNPAWLQLQLASGGFTLNSGCTFYGQVTAPNGTVIVNGNSKLVGTSASDQFILNSGGVVQWNGSATTAIQPPVATAQSITLAENASTNITLTASDPQGDTLTYLLLSLPNHGSLSGTLPNLTYKPATNYFGSDSFTFKVNNGMMDSSPATVSLAVTRVYYPPTSVSQTLTNSQNAALPVTLTGSDVEGNPLSYFVVTQPAHGTLTGTPPNLIYQPATNYYGNDSFTFRVNNGISNSSAAVINITNQPVNYPPVVVAGPDQLIILPTTNVTLTGSVYFSPFPGAVNTVVWSKVGGPGPVYFSNPSNNLTSATFNQSGVYTIRLFAADSFLSSSDDVVVMVNAPPLVNAGQGLTNNFPGTITLAGFASDDGVPTNARLTKVWGKISGPSAVVFGDAAATNSTATFGANGVYMLRLTADDGIATNHADITVIENLPPSVNAGPTQTVNFGATVTLSGAVADDELPNNILTSIWKKVSGQGNVAFANATLTNSTVTFDQPGIYTLSLIASDTFTTTNAEVTIRINAAPIVHAGSHQIVTLGTSVNLAGSYTDDGIPDASITTLWTQISGPSTAIFSDPSNLGTTVNVNQSGIYVFQLAADDGLTNGSAQVTATVNQIPVIPTNNPPTVSIISPVDGYQFQFGQLISLEALASDPDGVVTNLTLLADGIEIVKWVAPPFVTNWNGAAAGRHVLSAVATDDQGATTVSAVVFILVVDESGNLTVDAGPDQIISLPDPVVLVGNVEIPTLVEGSPTNVVWAKLGGPGSVQFSTPNTLNTSATFSEPGIYTLKLQIEYAGQGRGDLLQVDVLPAPPDRLTAARSSQGTDFWLTFLNNDQRYYETYHYGLELIISAAADTVGTIHYNTQYGTQNQTFQVNAGSLKNLLIDLWSQLPLDVSDSIQDNAIHVTADHPVTVYGLNYMDFTTDGYLALPTSMLGTDYIVLTYRNSPS